MENSKHFWIVFLMVFTVLFISCGNDEEEQLKYQNETITNLFGINGCNATIKGYMKDSEWKGVVEKIETALNAAYAIAVGPFTSIYGNVFYNNGIEIIVEKNPNGYIKWKTTEDGKKMYLSFYELDNNLQSSVNNAIMKMNSKEEGSE